MIGIKMIRIHIPKTAPQGGDLRITMHIGRQGYTRTEVLKRGKWTPNKEFYVDPDTIHVDFARKGVKHNWEETMYLKPW